MDIKCCLKKLAEGHSLSEREAFECFLNLFDRKIEDSQAGALLFGLKVKRESLSEVTGAVKAALKKARLIFTNEEKTIDTCGTGGDGKNSFNCSTAVALFLADMGYKVVKHGNRAVSGRCGSADVLEKLKVPFPEEESKVKQMLDKFNFAFLYAPHFHPSFKSVASIRRGLGIPTIFNLMGPLLNPARPRYQLVGVADPKIMDIVAGVLKNMEVERAAIVHGAGGFDEITPCGTSRVLLLNRGKLKSLFIDPRDFGFELSIPEELTFDSREKLFGVMKQILTGIASQPVKNMVSLNLGMCLYILEEKCSLKDSMMEARKKVNQGITNIKELISQ